MTDPRDTNPRYDDPPNSNLSSERGSRAMWGWIAGIAVVILVAFILAAGWNGDTNTASNPPAATTGAGPAMQAVPPATGNGAMAPHTPSPNPAPNPAPSGTK